MLDLIYLNKYIGVLEGKKKKIENLFNDIGVKIEKKEKASNLRNFAIDIDNLRELRIAGVMDTFTKESYAPECKLLELTPSNWKIEIDEFKPHLIFIESAWQGKNGLWHRKIANGSKEYFEMTSYCQEKNIPIAFWNKEDPVYTDTFMLAAKMADYVFTTDIDCIKKYKQNLCHDNVFLLHFAAQPKVHNPIEKYYRNDKYCFAGAYYHKYVNRCKVFDDFAKFFIETKGFDIYDRNYKNALPEHAFPKMYDKYILGNLKSSEIDVAYKGYNFGINMNSVEQSQTMFARRVFEMMASNTVTIGNYSRGVKNLFGDLTISTNDGETLKLCIDKWCSNEESMRKFRLLGLRKVLGEHLYEDRLSYIVEKVFAKTLKKELPEVTVLSFPKNAEEVEYILYAFENQSYENKKMLLVTNEEILSCPEKVEIISVEKASEGTLNTNGWATVFKAENYYGKSYLMDIMLTNRYGDFEGMGKADFYKNSNGNINILDIKSTYKPTNKLQTDRSIFKNILFKDMTFKQIINTESIENEKLFCVDEFNFCEGFTGHRCESVDDIFIADTGSELKNLDNIAENIEINDFFCSGKTIGYGEIFDLIITDKYPEITIEKKEDKAIIQSRLDDDKNFYINIEQIFSVLDYIQDGYVSIKFGAQGSLDVLGVCVFYDKNDKKVLPIFTKTNRFYKAEVPHGAEYFKLSLRVKGTGTFDLNDIVIGGDGVSNEKSCFISRSNVLVLTNQYPSQDALYRNMFVHKRLTSYKEEGLLCDVMRMNIYANNEYREFEGINVVEGHGEELGNILETGNIDTVCVHFLDRQMWEILKGFEEKIRIIVWVHGAEIQPWWRREYNYTTKEELEKAKVISDERMKFWAEVFGCINKYNIHFVFVSKYFANEVFEDNKISLPEEKFSIIHNLIDTDVFKYIPKQADSRFKIMTVKPFASKKYANDLTTKAIVEMSKDKRFEKFQFDIYGDGEYFDTENQPLKKFKNVTLNKTFLTQKEIYELHKAHGVFIATTRWDSHGVSRDEAMSSGLVVITNKVAAIPEFVDDNCGIMVPQEDYKGIVNELFNIYNEPEYFLRLSENAAKRVRTQTSKEYTIDKEIQLINGN